jgi:hypothetical protein
MLIDHIIDIPRHARYGFRGLGGCHTRSEHIPFARSTASGDFDHLREPSRRRLDGVGAVTAEAEQQAGPLGFWSVELCVFWLYTLDQFEDRIRAMRVTR